MNNRYDSEYERDRRRDWDERGRGYNLGSDNRENEPRDMNRGYDRPNYSGQNWPGRNQDDSRYARERFLGGRSSGYGGEQYDRYSGYNQENQGRRYPGSSEGYGFDRAYRGYSDEGYGAYGTGGSNEYGSGNFSGYGGSSYSGSSLYGTGGENNMSPTRGNELSTGYRSSGSQYGDYRQGSQGYRSSEPIFQGPGPSGQNFSNQQQYGRHTGRGPRGYQRSDERIHEDVNDRLTAHPDIDATEIMVTVRAGEVTLTGMVDERHAKRMAEDLVESVSGVKEVHNQIHVNRSADQWTTGSQGGSQTGSQTAGSLLGSHGTSQTGSTTGQKNSQTETAAAGKR